MKNIDLQYNDLVKRILKEGEFIPNKRTGVRCLTVINAEFEYDSLPILTTKKVFVKSAIAEILGYIKGYSNAKDFEKEGTKTWNANANENADWLRNSNRQCENDMGRVYGVQGRYWINQFGEMFDQFQKIAYDLKEGIDDRGEILTFWNPGEFEYGCLRPCMHSYHYSILNGTLYLNITQRSSDVPLGLPFNLIQGYVMLLIMSEYTGLKMGKVYHKLVNVHIYENQIEILKEQIINTIHESSAELVFNGILDEFDDFEELTVNNFELLNYSSHDAIKYPFTV